MASDQSKKKKNAFTIIKDDPTDGHGGYGGASGVVSLQNMSSIIVDPNEGTAYLEMGAMHGRSDVERRVKYFPDKDAVPDGKLYWIVWVNVERGDNGPYYSGVAGSELRIDRPNKRAYKSMPEHVKHMEQSLKGQIVIDHMDEKSKRLLLDYLADFDEAMWNNSSDELKQALME